MLRRVAMAYLDLLRTEGLHGLTVQAQGEAAEIARLTDDYAKVKDGRQADADRALTERENRDIDRIDADAKVGTCRGPAGRVAQPVPGRASASGRGKAGADAAGSR